MLSSPLPRFPQLVQDGRDPVDEAIALPYHPVAVEDEHVRLVTPARRPARDDTASRGRASGKKQSTRRQR